MRLIFILPLEKAVLGWQRELIMMCFLFWRQRLKRFCTGEIPGSIQMFIFVLTQEHSTNINCILLKVHFFRKKSSDPPTKSIKSIGEVWEEWGRAQGQLMTGELYRWLLEEGICRSKPTLVLPEYAYAGLCFCVYINSSHLPNQMLFFQITCELCSGKYN